MAGNGLYRRDGGHVCIDIRVRTAAQLFDGRDPAPFLERDLDQHAVEYILDAADEIAKAEPLRLVVHVAEGPEPALGADVVQDAMTSHFQRERQRAARELARHMRRAYAVAAIGLATLTAFLGLAELMATRWPGTLGRVLQEGLVITGWVALWRPLDLLLYDWWPIAQDRARLDRLAASDIVVVFGTDSGGSA